MSDKRYRLRKQVKSVRWMIFWVVLAQLAAETLVAALVSFMSNPPHSYIRIAAVELIAIGVPIMIYAHTAWNGQEAKAELCLNKCGMGFVVIAAVLGICGQFVMMLLNIPANLFVSRVLNQSTANGIPVAIEWTDILLGFLSVVIIPAVLEEFWMRGIIFRAYNKCNTLAAVLFTAIIFAFLHLRLNELLGFLFMGVTASFVLIKSGSLYASMIYHGFSNLTALLFGVFIAPLILDVIWLVFIFAVLIFAGIFVGLVKQKSKMPITREFGAKGLVINSIFSLPVLLSIAIVILKNFLVNVAG